MAWNPNDYEMVEVRIRKFLEEQPDGRIVTELIPDEHDWIFKRFIYLDVGEQATLLPKGVGYATEKKGSSPFAAEVAETSSIGRGLANMGLHGNKRASREEMRKVSSASRLMVELLPLMVTSCLISGRAEPNLRSLTPSS